MLSRVRDAEKAHNPKVGVMSLRRVTRFETLKLKAFRDLIIECGLLFNVI
jgi:hypothetical protein